MTTNIEKGITYAYNIKVHRKENMEIIVSVCHYRGNIVGVNARKAPYVYKASNDDSDPTVTEFVIELEDYSAEDIQTMSYCDNKPRKWTQWNRRG